MHRLLLASSSRYRAQLLQRLGLKFATEIPVCDETPLSGETPENLVIRLAELKSRSVKRDKCVTASGDGLLVIGSDQVADLNGDLIGKPGSVEHACEQLARVSGHSVIFRTGLCLLDAASDQVQLECVNVQVQFRLLTAAEIERYVAQNQPLDCACSFRSEALGVSLLDGMRCSDPTALIGLPLIRLCRMLRRAGVVVP